MSSATSQTWLWLWLWTPGPEQLHPVFFPRSLRWLVKIKQRKRFHRHFLRKPGLVGYRLLKFFGVTNVSRIQCWQSTFFFWGGGGGWRLPGWAGHYAIKADMHFEEFNHYGPTCHFTIISDELKNHWWLFHQSWLTCIAYSGVKIRCTLGSNPHPVTVVIIGIVTFLVSQGNAYYESIFICKSFSGGVDARCTCLKFREPKCFECFSPDSFCWPLKEASKQKRRETKKKCNKHEKLRKTTASHAC